MDSFNDFWDSLGNGVSTTWNWFTSPIGTGKNATTPLELALPSAVGLYGIYNQNKQAKKAFELAQQQLNDQRNLTQFNALQNGTILGTNLLNQAQGRAEFNSDSALPYVNYASDAMNQIANASQRLGIDNSSWANTLKGFDALKSSLA